MADPTTTNLVLSAPVRNSDTGTWDTPMNGNSSILDACLGSVTSTSLTNLNVILTTTQSQVAILRFTGALTGNVVITLGAVIKSWVCENLCTGAFTVTVKGSPGTGNVVGLPPGSCQIYWDGTNVSFLNMGIVGQYWDDCSSVVPSWVTACTVPPYLNCNGSTFSAVTYPLLNAKLGGNTLPDARGRFRATLNQATGRITNGVNGNVNLAGGGSDTQTILAGQVPPLPLTISVADGRSWSVPQNTGAATGGNAVVPGANLGGSTPLAATPTGSITASGTANNGVSNTPVVTMPPAYIGGITLIRAA